MRVRCAGTIVEIDTHRGAIVAEVADLDPERTHPLTIEDDAGRRELAVRTMPDIGPVRSRFATISDLHLGSEAFGPLKRIVDTETDPYALRCATAAVREAESWGAELLLIKGDITEHGTLAHWDEVAALLESITVPVLVTPGNHDVFTSRMELAAVDAFSQLGLDYRPVQQHDLPGVRVVLADTSVEGRGMGSLRPVAEEILSAAAGTDRPVFLALHHNISRTPIPWFWPPGITSTDARPLVRRLGAANDNIFISSGHTHRHRRHWIGPGRRILFTEVGATSDYPGTWAGYEVSDHSIRQVVRRIADPASVTWTERTRRAVGGLWPMWSQGRLDDRCIDLVLRR